jgi:hypothetical protein
MKKVLYTSVSAFVFAMMVASCKKEETPTPNPPTNDTTNTNKTAPTFTPTIADINGSLIALQTKTTVTQSGFSVDNTIETATAVFYGTGSTIVDAGTVSVNGFDLAKQTNNSYLKAPSATSTTLSLNFSTGASWLVSGNSNVSAISYKHGANFPQYTGEVPTSITKANGLSFTFNASNVKNADSVYVFIAASDGKTFMKAFAPDAGTVNITASELSGLTTNSNNSAFLEVIPVTYTVQNISGKRYAFIKEQACVKNVNIN